MNLREFSCKSVWIYVAAILMSMVCREEAFAAPAKPLDTPSEIVEKKEIGDGVIRHNFSGRNDSGAVWVPLNAESFSWEAGEILPPQLVEKTTLKVTELPIEYIQAGEILLAFHVDEKGEVTEVKILEPFRGELPTTLVKSIMKWRFSPLSQKGKAVACAYAHRERIYPFSVTLQEGEFADVPPTIKNLKGPFLFILGDEETAASLGVRPYNPFYPMNVRGYHRFGKLLLSGIVDEKGRLKKVKVEEADFPEHRKAIKKIVQKWKFNPGMKNKEIVSTKVWIDFVIYPPIIELITEEEGLISPVVLKAYDLGGTVGNTIRFGSVVLVFTINENGKVEDLEVEHCDVPALIERIRKTFLQWEFQPGVKDGKAVKTRARYSVNYRSEDFLPRKDRFLH